jgi:hypothetical protein
VDWRARAAHATVPRELRTSTLQEASLWTVGVIIACIGGFVVVAVRQGEHSSRGDRAAEILGYGLILIGLGFVFVWLFRLE